MLWEHVVGCMMLLALVLSVITAEGSVFFDTTCTLCLFVSIAMSL